MYQQNKGEGVRFFVLICILSVLIMYVCIYLYVFTNTWPIPDSEGIGA